MEGYELGTAETIEEAFERRTNPFDELSTRELRTQWKHKVSVIPESEGITTRWWTFSAGVTRDGPEMKVPAGETAGTKESGEYNVGDPAIAGGAFRVEGTAKGSDDAWTGFTNRNDKSDANADGAGVGYKDFTFGEGDAGGTIENGPQEYVWFMSSVSGVPDLVVPRDRWNGDDIGVPKGELFHRGGFVREPFTFYNQGAVNVNYGVKQPDGDIEVKTLHTFSVFDNPMWGQSDLKWQAGTVGSNVTGYLNAAHYKAGETNMAIRGNGEGRDGSVMGSGVTVNSGDPRPLISIKLRSGWENVNIQPQELSVSMDDSFYVFVSIGSDLSGATWSKPSDDLPGVDPAGSEYAVQTDNDASDFNSIGEIEFLEDVGPGGEEISRWGGR